MGFSCTAAASDTMNRLTRACWAQTKSQNRFQVNGEFFFFEQDRTEHRDGSITGDIQKEVGNDRCRKVGNFKIDAAGVMVKGHDWMKENSRPKVATGWPQA